MQGQDSQNLMGKHSLLSLTFSAMTALCLKYACQILSSSACNTLKDPLKNFREKLDAYERAKYKRAPLATPKVLALLCTRWGWPGMIHCTLSPLKYYHKLFLRGHTEGSQLNAKLDCQQKGGWLDCTCVVWHQRWHTHRGKGVRILQLCNHRLSKMLHYFGGKIQDDNMRFWYWNMYVSLADSYPWYGCSA